MAMQQEEPSLGLPTVRRESKTSNTAAGRTFESRGGKEAPGQEMALKETVSSRRESSSNEIPLLTDIPVMPLSSAHFSLQQKAELDFFASEVKQKKAHLVELTAVFTGLKREQSSSDLHQREEIDTDKLKTVESQIDEATRLGEQYKHLYERTLETLLLLKNKVKATKAHLASLQLRAAAAAEEVTAILLDANTTCGQYAQLQGYVHELRTAREAKCESLQSEVIVSHAATNIAFRVGNKEAIRQAKLKRHVQKLQERTRAQHEQRVRLLMSEGVLQIAACKLSQKFNRLFATFQTEDVDVIINRFREIQIRETMHTTEMEDRLQQNAKLMDTMKDLIRIMLKLRTAQEAKGEQRELSEDELRLLGTYGARIREEREMSTRVVTTLASLLLKFRAADFHSQLGVYPTLPSSLSVLFLTFEKVVLAAYEVQRTHKPPKLKPMFIAMRHLLKGMLEPGKSPNTRQRMSKSFVNFLTKPPVTENPTQARIRALCRDKEEDKANLSLENEELALAAEEMKTYKLTKSNTEETLMRTAPSELKAEVTDCSAEKSLKSSLSLREVDRRLDELVKTRRRMAVPGRSEVAQVILSLKKTTLRLTHPDHFLPLVATPKQMASDPSYVLPTTHRGKRLFTQQERTTCSPGLSSRSTVKDSIVTPRGDHVDRLKRLAGLEKS